MENGVKDIKPVFISSTNVRYNMVSGKRNEFYTLYKGEKKVPVYHENKTGYTLKRTK